MDALILSRMQFAWVIALHILLPAFTVGLSCYIATLEVRWWLSKDDVYRRLSAFWIKIFAVSFGMGVVSGIVMPFQFGTNWSRLSDATANIISPLLAYEGLTAFFLEAAFLGILLFGRDRVPRWVHFVAALMVAAGTLFSSFWILAANSWMQTPQGFEIVDGRFFPTSMLAVIFTPSFPYRLVHTVTAFVVTAAFVIMGVGARYLRQGRFVAESQLMVRMSILFLALMVPLQVLVGDLHGLNTLEYQPVKLAAMEGLWETRAGVPASLFAIPDEQAEKNRFEIAIPLLGSIYLTHHVDGTVRGLKDFPRADRPPVAVALVMLAVVAAGIILLWRRRLYSSAWFLRVATLVSPIGFVAVLAGWTTTEVGRQPWVIYGQLRTAQALTPSLTPGDVMISLALYMVSYLIIFGGGFMLLRRLVTVGPNDAPEVASQDEVQRAARPLSAAADPHPSQDASLAGEAL